MRERLSYWRKPWSILLLFTLVFAMVIGGTALARPSQQGATVLKIGYLGRADSDMARGLQLAIDEINAAGGTTGPNSVTYVFELVVAEVTPADAAGVSGAITTLTNQQVAAIFGPDSNELAIPNISALSSAVAPVLTAATDDVFLNQDATGNVFRIVAPESVYESALATYMVSERALQRITVIQTDAAWDAAVIAFNTTLNQLQAPPLQVMQITDTTQLMANIVTLPEQNPDAIVMFGTAADSVGVLSVLRDSGWTGVFAIRTADSLSISDPLLAGTLSVDSWTFGAKTELGNIFIGNYVSQYGAVPGPLSVAGYDTLYALSSVISSGGPAPAVVRQLLSQMSTQNLVRGPIDPAAYGARTLSRTAYIFELTGKGGTRGLVAYDNNVLRQLSIPADSQGPTATATPLPTATFTPIPSATPNVVTATVNNRVLNVRAGPGTNYPVLDQLSQGEQVVVAGRNDNFQWLFIQYEGRVGWVAAEFVNIFDPGGLVATLPIVQPPPTPTPGPTQRPTDADLIITGVTLSPTSPQPSVPVTATVTIANVGTANAGPFAIATSFLPGEIYSAQNLGGLASGQTITTTLTATFSQTGYVPDLAFVVDLNNQVFEGTAGETNNTFNIAYKVDRAIATQAQSTLNASFSINFFGPNLDMTWTGTQFNMLGAAKIGLMPAGQTYEIVHYDQVPSNATGTSFSNPAPGMVFAIITDEGQYGFFRVDNLVGSDITISYRVYTP